MRSCVAPSKTWLPGNYQVILKPPVEGVRCMLARRREMCGAGAELQNPTDFVSIPGSACEERGAGHEVV
jgi:hypothetical protein